MARIDKKGRRKRGDPFIMVRWQLYDSPAFLSMKPGPRALLLALVRRYDGRNNGAIALGVRDAAAELGLSDKDTVHRYFRELEHKGFIRIARPSSFNMKDASARRATEWRLTWLDAPTMKATNDFIKWGLDEEK